MAVVSKLPVDDIIKELEKFKDFKKGEKAKEEKFDFPYDESVFKSYYNMYMENNSDRILMFIVFPNLIGENHSYWMFFNSLILYQP